MSVLNGPGEGTWAAFAGRVVRERDEALDRIAKLEAVVEAARAFASSKCWREHWFREPCEVCPNCQYKAFLAALDGVTDGEEVERG